MNSQRLKYIDLGAGIMIFWMMIGHAIMTQFRAELFGFWDVTDLSLIPHKTHAVMDDNGHIGLANPNSLFPYLHFFMPWFFYKSGQFYKPNAIITFIIKDAQKLLWQFLVWSIVGYVMYIAFCFAFGSFTFHSVTYSVLRKLFLEGAIEINTPLWFLLTLFGIRQVVNIVCARVPEKYIVFVFSVLLVVGYLFSYLTFLYNHRLLPLWVANGAAGLAFFSLGYIAHKYETKWWLLIPCLLGYIACCIWGFPVVSMRTNTLSSGLYLLNLPACFAGIVVFNFVCRMVVRLIPQLWYSPFILIGRKAMILYVIHGLIYGSIINILELFELESIMPYTLWIILFFYVILIFFTCNTSKRNFAYNEINNN
ncbi:acyltransferase family protein [Pseudobutyrivibrio sp.]|uniref:acyltransferase family protein n=1 Tax=Pseudobutyrivibrio sp. TaxID=2014367 RepID=UPI00386FB738